eukprot:6573824-Prorocentrum_lima.AAC.1
MTSSLVGSEMCIRDSARGVRHIRFDFRSWRCPLRTGEFSRCPASTTSGSVSYTHLTLPTICSV